MAVDTICNLSSRKDHRVLAGEKEKAIPRCNQATIPGVVSERACAYYGARWVLGAIPDAVHLVHGPVGCAFYGSIVRKKNYTVFSTDLQEKDVVLGAGNRLYQAILEAAGLFPEAGAVFVYSTCAAGIMGDDLEAICNRATGNIKKKVIPVNCPGFKSVSQAGGHDIATRILLDHFILNGHIKDIGVIENGVNILGEFDVQGDLTEIRNLLKQLGIEIVCAVSGKASINDLAAAHKASLNIVHCKRTGHFLAEEMEKTLGIPFIEASFFGLAKTRQALEKIGTFFNVPEVEGVMTNLAQKIEADISHVKEKIAGKRVSLFFGASRMGLMTKAFRELGMDVVVMGSQFGCPPDYEEALKNAPPGAELIDDANDRELEELILKHRLDLLVGGTKEKYLSHKLATPFLVFPQETNSFAGFSGFVNLAQETAALVNAPVWKLYRTH